MGIRNLNRYLKESCPDSIRCINLVELSGKRIAVDISIYLYRYEAENALLENMYVMLSIFRHYNIIPIFILMTIMTVMIIISIMNIITSKILLLLWTN